MIDLLPQTLAALLYPRRPGQDVRAPDRTKD